MARFEVAAFMVNRYWVEKDWKRDVVVSRAIDSECDQFYVTIISTTPKP